MLFSCGFDAFHTLISQLLAKEGLQTSSLAYLLAPVRASAGPQLDTAGMEPMNIIITININLILVTKTSI